MAPKVRKRAQSGRRDAAGGKKRKLKGTPENGDVVGKRKSRDEEDDRYGNEAEAPVSEEEDEEVDLETADEKRLRLARAFLDRTRQAAADAEVCSRLISLLKS
jgi:nitrogen fixation protein FixH